MRPAFARCAVVLGLGLLFGFSATVSAVTWTGAGGNNLVSNPGNWVGNVAPAGSGAFNFQGAPTVVNNDLSSFFAYSINFKTPGFTLIGNAIKTGYLSFDGGATTVSVPLIGDENDFPSMEFHFADGASAMFTESITNKRNTYFYGGRFVLSGSSGRIDSPAGSQHGLALFDSTMVLDNSGAVNADRLDDDLTWGSVGDDTLQLIGSSAAGGNLVETIKQAYITRSVIEVVGNGSAFDTKLSMLNPISGAANRLVVYHSLGTAGEVLGSLAPGPKISLGSSSSGFLGPDQLYLSGSFSSGNYQFAAHDSVRGVIAATSSSNLATATFADHVMLDSPSNVTAAVTVASLALNGVTLGGSGTVTVKNVLLAHQNEISADVDFGSTSGTVTVANFDKNQTSVSTFSGDILGSGSLLFTGKYGKSIITSDATFSGNVAVTDGMLELGGSGRLSHVSAIDVTRGTLNLTADGGNHLTTSAPITLRDGGELRVTASPTGHAAQLVDNVAIQHTFAERVPTFTVDSSGSAHGATLNIGSLSLLKVPGQVLNDTSFNLSTYGNGNTISIGGASLVMDSPTALVIDTHGGQNNTFRIPPRDQSSAYGFTNVTLNTTSTTTIATDLKIYNGSLNLARHSGTLDGDLLFTDAAEIFLGALGDSDMENPFLSINGDLTLDGYMRIKAGNTVSHAPGQWLIFEYTGSFTNNGANLSNVDYPGQRGLLIGYPGNIKLMVDEIGKRVYLEVIPEPSAWLLLLSGFIGLMVLRNGSVFAAKQRR